MRAATQFGRKVREIVSYFDGNMKLVDVNKNEFVYLYNRPGGVFVRKVVKAKSPTQ